MLADKNKVGMLAFLASESVFFLLLLLAFLYFQSTGVKGPNARGLLEPGITLFFSVFLFSSSLTIWLAERSLKAGNRVGLIVWLIVTVALGATFLVGQGIEYAGLFEKDVTVARNTFGTSFFTLTGLHGIHVFIGLVMLSILAGYSIAGFFKGNHSSALETISLYWHFVDIVWVVIFSVIYLNLFF